MQSERGSFAATSGALKHSAYANLKADVKTHFVIQMKSTIFSD